MEGQDVTIDVEAAGQVKGPAEVTVMVIVLAGGQALQLADVVEEVRVLDDEYEDDELDGDELDKTELEKLVEVGVGVWFVVELDIEVVVATLVVEVCPTLRKHRHALLSLFPRLVVPQLVRYVGTSVGATVEEETARNEVQNAVALAETFVLCRARRQLSR